jgi:predicted RNase H-like HicB family nuclease
MILPYCFVVTLEQDEEGWFIASVEDLPGVVSQGESIQEAMENIAGAVEDALEVMKEGTTQGDVTKSPGVEEPPYSTMTPVRIEGVRAA